MQILKPIMVNKYRKFGVFCTLNRPGTTFLHVHTCMYSEKQTIKLIIFCTKCIFAY